MILRFSPCSSPFCERASVCRIAFIAFLDLLLILPNSFAQTNQSTIEVPNLVGLTEQQAKHELQLQGLEVGSVSFRCGDELRVIGQDPIPGEKVPIGSSVNISMSDPCPRATPPENQPANNRPQRNWPPPDNRFPENRPNAGSDNRPNENRPENRPNDNRPNLPEDNRPGHTPPLGNPSEPQQQRPVNPSRPENTPRGSANQSKSPNVAELHKVRQIPPARSANPWYVLSTIDQTLAQLRLGTIAFYVPDTMERGQSYDIKLLLSATKSLDELKKELSGKSETAEIRVSPKMEARLTGQDFEINAVRSETQAVTEQETTEWEWEVRPSHEGSHQLHLTLDVILSVNGAETPRSLQTFDRTITVEVGFGKRAFGFVTNNWQWLWTAVFIPLGAWLWKKKRWPPAWLNKKPPIGNSGA